MDSCRRVIRLKISKVNQHNILRPSHFALSEPTLSRCSLPPIPTRRESLFKANAANPTVRNERGACGNVSHGRTMNPLHKPKRCMMETLHLKLSAPYFYPTPRICCIKKPGDSMDEAVQNWSQRGQFPSI